MKHLMLCGAILLPWVSGEVVAACTNGSQVKDNALINLLSGKTININFGSENWKEQHIAGGVLNKVGKGCSDPVDPTVQVGTWAEVGNGTSSRVRYNYGTGGIYDWSVHLISTVGTTTVSYCTGPGGTLKGDGTLTLNAAACP